jgi:Homing endonuclease associated repeat
LTNGDRSNVWTREQIIQEIQHMALIEGTEPYAPHISKNAPQDIKRIVGAARRAYGSWAKAVEAAGLKYRDYQGD